MKKVIFALAAVVALAACSKEQTVVADRGDAIGFDSFIENSTRAIDPSYNANKLVDGFKVWGTVKGNASNSPMLLFNGVEIVRNNKAYGAAWEYVNNTDAQYWIPNAEYNFAAIANATDVIPGENGMPKAIKYTANNTDLIYTLTGVTAKTDENSDPTEGVNDDDVVEFTFNHLLSKVHFNFVNQSGSDNCKFEISNIEITSGALLLLQHQHWILAMHQMQLPQMQRTRQSRLLTVQMQHLIMHICLSQAHRLSTSRSTRLLSTALLRPLRLSLQY